MTSSTPRARVSVRLVDERANQELRTGNVGALADAVGSGEASAGMHEATIEQELRRLEHWIESTPVTHAVKGMYVRGLHDVLRAKDVGSYAGPPVHPFKDYPLRAYMRQLIDAARILYRDLPVMESLRRLGELAIPTFAQSIAGGVTMAIVGRRWELALRCVSAGYELSLKPGSCTVASIEDGRARLELRNVWNFADSYQVGVVQGLMKWCGVEGRTTPMPLSMCDVDLVVEWTSTDHVPSAAAAPGRAC